jgi:tricorn protease
MTDDYQPSFDPGGKYLYFISRRTVNPQFGAFELDFQFRSTDRIYALGLSDTTLSPVSPKSDEETGGGTDKGGADKSKDKDAAKPGAKDAKADAKPEAATRIDLAGLTGRCAEIPVPAGRYTNLSALSGKILYVALADFDPDADGPAGGSIHFYDLEKRKDKTVLADVSSAYATNKDGTKLLYKDGDAWGIVDIEADKKSGDGKIKTDGLMALVDPRQEWMQMFDEAWRLERDFYYDPKMGGLDWKAMGERYRPLVPYVAHRSDLNYILGELIGELSTSHSYVGGGDMPDVPRTGVGLLGVDWAMDNSGYYRFQKVYRERDWNSRVSAPLGEPGINVREGDLLLEVNGTPVKAPMNVYAAFVGTSGKQTRIKVGTSANDAKARTYTVVPVGSEASLRYVSWVNTNREKVYKATDGRIAYIHVPNTALAGIQEFTKQYYPQVDKQGIIVDERFNGGGFIPDFFIERLWRTTWVQWSNRDGEGFRTPGTAIDGPKCMVINEYAGSGGDAFPFYFRMQGLGPVIGKRTWGGLVGISHSLPFADGGSVTMPDFGMYDPKTGQWLVENHGVDPDIEVENSPDQMVAGHDPQLERAIQYCLDELKKNPPHRQELPAFRVQEGLK